MCARDQGINKCVCVCVGGGGGGGDQEIKCVYRGSILVSGNCGGEGRVGRRGGEGRGTKKLNVCTGDQYLCEWKLVWGGMGVDHGMNACVWLIYQ